MHKALLFLSVLALATPGASVWPDEASTSASSQAHIRYADVDVWANTIAGELPHDIQASGSVHYESQNYSLTCDSLIYSFETADFEAIGDVRAVFKDAALGDTVVTAAHMAGNDRDGDVLATGDVVLTGKDRRLTGNSLAYNLKTNEFTAKDNVHAAYKHNVYGDILLNAERMEGNLKSTDIKARDRVSLRSRYGILLCDDFAYNLDNARFTARENVKAIYDDATHGKVVLNSDNLEGDIGTGDIQARGNVSVTNEENRLTGDNLTYNLNTQQFVAEGNVRANYNHPEHGEAVLTAGTVRGDQKTGDLAASGSVTLRNKEKILNSDNLIYNLQSQLFSAEGNARIVHKDITRGDAVLTSKVVSGTLSTADVEASGNVHLSDEQVNMTSNLLRYNFRSRVFDASGNVQTIYTNPRQEHITLHADTVVGNSETGDVEASGNVLFENEGRTLTGSDFTYNFKTEEGIAEDASANANGVYFHGSKLRSGPGGYTVTGARLTTCDQEHPHYYLSAREIVIEPEKKLVARGVSVNLLGMTLLKLPRYSVGLGEGGESKPALPSISLDDRQGAYIAYEFDISHEPRTLGGLGLRLSEKHGLQGGLLYDQLTGRPIFARLTHREPCYEGGRSDLLLSRAPEIGVRFCSGASAQSYALSRSSIGLSGRTINPLLPTPSGNRVNTVTEIGFGRFTEYPDRVTSERLDARLLAWIDTIPVDSRTVFSPGISLRFSHYTNGEDYSAYGLRLAIARRLGADSYLSLAYITNSMRGRTPFEFDRVELREELAGKLRLPLGNFRLELGGRYDIRGGDWYDTEIFVAQKLHCLEPKIGWRSRFKEFSFGIGLVGL